MASVLNADREIIIRDKVFKFVDKGLLQTTFDKRETLKEFEEICKLMSNMQEEQAKKSFEIGYSMGVNLTLEAIENGKIKN